LSVDVDVKAQVREFYDSIGWRQIGEGVYQNARYEDLRPVSREYIHRCHLRVARYLPATGRFLLDAGSGPIQYPEYLEYSRGFQRRVCLDVSRRALIEARARIGVRGLYVVGDIANLPFREGSFEGLVSLHTVHHLPPGEHRRAFDEFLRVLRPAGRAVVVYSWGDRSVLTRLTGAPIRGAFWLLRAYRRLRGKEKAIAGPAAAAGADQPSPEATGTYTHKHDYRWARTTLGDLPGFEIRVWRSVSTSFLRAFIHRQLLGRFWLRLLFWLEERAPHFFGQVGQYPSILFCRPAVETGGRERVA
jgi:SAM-dependent methyltransferase